MDNLFAYIVEEPGMSEGMTFLREMDEKGYHINLFNLRKGAPIRLDGS